MGQQVLLMLLHKVSLTFKWVTFKVLCWYAVCGWRPVIFSLPWGQQLQEIPLSHGKWYWISILFPKYCFKGPAFSKPQYCDNSSCVCVFWHRRSSGWPLGEEDGCTYLSCRREIKQRNLRQTDRPDKADTAADRRRLTHTNIRTWWQADGDDFTGGDWWGWVLTT